MNDFPVVALVCSAGGLDALTCVLAPLPADLPAAVVALQHLPPAARTHLPDILGRRTALEVASAAHGDALTPGRVLIAPPGHHTLITAEQTIALIPSGPIPPTRPSADLLLTTLALAAGARAVAVVLSGHGNDGATGATAVHQFGGTVITSDSTSTAPSMPNATATRDTITDHGGPVDDIAALLLALATTRTLRPA